MKRKIWITFAVSAMMVVATMTLATTGKLLRAQENKEDTVEQQKNSISAQDLKAPNLHVVCVKSEIPNPEVFGWVVSYAWDEVSGADQYEYEMEGEVQGHSGTTKETSLVFSIVACDGEKSQTVKVRAIKTVNGEITYGPYSEISVSPKEIIDRPSNLKVSTTGDEVTLSWNKVNGAESYIIWKGTGSGLQPWHEPHELIDDVTTTSYSFGKLPVGTYSFWVCACKKTDGYLMCGHYGVGVKYEVYDGIPKNVQAMQASATRLRVVWNPVNGATGYQVWRATSEEGPFTALGSVTGTERVCVGLTTGNTYYFKVRSYVENNGARKYSDFSEVVSGIPRAINPENVKVNGISSTKTLVSWSETDGATGYQVWRATSEEGPFTALGSVSGTERLCIGLTSGTTYYFKVRAFNDLNGTKAYSAFSEVASFTTGSVSPSNVMATTTYSTRVKLTWEKVDGATGYQVWRATSEEGPYIALGSVSETERLCVGLTLGTTYYFKVRAYYLCNGTKHYSEYSDVVSAVPSPPNPPTNFTVKKKENPKSRDYCYVIFSWDEVDDDESVYEIFFATSEEGPYKSLFSTNNKSGVTWITRETKFPKGETIYFKIRAKVRGPFGDFSEVVSLKW